MSLFQININNFRLFSDEQLTFDEVCNLFCGENGSGKTSLLEAIYYLALGRSFLTHLPRRVIKQNQDNLSLFGKIKLPNHELTVGITRSITTGKQIKISGKELSSNIELIKLLPLQLLNHSGFSLLHDGPKARRQFLDWGLFHVEQPFLAIWRKLERSLEQRNIAIRSKAPLDLIRIWDKELAISGVELHNYRVKYIKDFLIVVQNILTSLLPNTHFNINYISGWNTELELEKALANNLVQDLQLGYTSIGPHRADLQITIGKNPAKDTLSRGQQKLLIYGLQIAQGVLLNNLTNKKCIYLIDDLLAELDQQKSLILADTLLNLKNSQLFITGLSTLDFKNIFNSAQNKQFTIKSGKFLP